MVVGLGNPGRRYENNRHNIGFRAVELYAERYTLDLAKKQSKALIGMGWRESRGRVPSQIAQPQITLIPRREGLKERGQSDVEPNRTKSQESNRAKEVKVILVKPQTYMNNSGEAVVALAGYYNVEPANILVIHDDMDLPTGKLRLRPGGGAGGQNGVRSIINRLSTKDFPRLRIGIGRPPGRMDPAAYVLQDFVKREAEQFGALADTVVEIIDEWLFTNIDSVMNKFNGRT
ncbi:MAG: aminoacyl-tRNA hydrolase [Chloroflexota bacterium]